MTARDLLQGKPLKMPLHTAIVHFPIALFTLSVVLDVGGYIVGGSNVAVRGAFDALTFGLIAAGIAAVPGLVDYTSIRSDHPARSTATWHLLLNVTAVSVYAISLALRWGRIEELRVPILPFVLSLIGIVIIAVSGYLGGTLVYGDGIGVGRHRRHVALPRQTLKVPAEDPNAFAPVAADGVLAEGQALRMDVGGTVMTLVRLDGQVYAFQEFCTHRHGPLSEGCFENSQVRCPWHNSRFDVRSGKVTHGPAKMDLKVFETQVREGRIWVRPSDARQPQPPSAPAREQQPAAQPKGATAPDADAKLRPDQQTLAAEPQQRSYW